MLLVVAVLGSALAVSFIVLVVVVVVVSAFGFVVVFVAESTDCKGLGRVTVDFLGTEAASSTSLPSDSLISPAFDFTVIFTA